MNEIFALINCTTSNLRELLMILVHFLKEFKVLKIKKNSWFSVGNLIMNLESQNNKLTLELMVYCNKII